VVNLFYQPRIVEGVLYLDEEESRHCIKVLRKQQGDRIRITDGKGSFYDALISGPDPRQCTFTVQERVIEPPRNFRIHIAISPTKNADRIEWFVEKSVEIGVDEISLLHCKTSERSFVKIERLTKVAVSAMKQSLKSTLPAIHGLSNFDVFIRQREEAQKFIAFVDPENPLHLKDVIRADNNVVVLIGPEGDFSTDELTQAIAAGFVKVSLGKSRLRTETAGIAACHICNLAIPNGV
jgi:16S rRNA (uracil1498-N3)-methyltransferase